MPSCRCRVWSHRCSCPPWLTTAEWDRLEKIACRARRLLAGNVRPPLVDLVALLELYGEHTVTLEIWAASLLHLEPAEYAGPGLPDSATQARPGSTRKLAILTERAASGTQLFHPDDLRYPQTHRDNRDAEEKETRDATSPTQPERISLEIE